MIAKIGHNEHDWGVTKRMIDSIRTDKKYTKSTFQEFAQKIKLKKDDLRKFIVNLKKNSDVKIYAYGAPAKGNTLLTYFGLDNELINKCVEVNELKIGKYLPVTHIPIIKESKDDVPEYYLLLAHNFVNEIIERYKNQKIKFIIPFPEIKIIET
jgi:hypothetical protein